MLVFPLALAPLREVFICDSREDITVVDVLIERRPAKGHTEITNAERLRIKECDRLEATRKELNGLGGKITEKADGLSIDGVDGFCGGEVADWTDHRITMTAAIASTGASGKVIINEPNSVKKSYPNFWRDFANLGGEYIEC